MKRRHFFGEKCVRSHSSTTVYYWCTLLSMFKSKMLMANDISVFCYSCDNYENVNNDRTKTYFVVSLIGMYSLARFQ